MKLHPTSESPPASLQRKGVVVSDLHLFSRRSDGERLFAEFDTDADDLVLNGDTFDFRWSRLPSEKATVDAAIEWLHALLAARPRRTVHFLLGNHDCHKHFHNRVVALAECEPRLECHEHRLRLGDCLFLHGDCANRRMDHEALVRFRHGWSRDRQRSAASAMAYTAVDSLGLSRRFHDWYFPPERTIRRVGHHLDHVMPGWSRRIRHCYFGHTHRPFRDLPHMGVLFHNTGSAIRGMGFQPLLFNWSPEKNTTPIP